MLYRKIQIRIVLLLAILMICSCNKQDDVKQVSPVDTVKPNNSTDPIEKKKETATKKDYSDLSVFWEDLLTFTLNDEKGKIAEMSFFPFLWQSEFLDKEDFLTDYAKIIKSLKNSAKSIKTPRKSQMFWEGGLDRKGNSVNVIWKEGTLYEVKAGSVTYYFGTDKNVYKMVGMLYGE